MLTEKLVGRRVKLNAWYDHEQLIAAHRRARAVRECPEGTVMQVNDFTGRVSVRVEELGRVFTFPLGDVEVLDSEDRQVG